MEEIKNKASEEVAREIVNNEFKTKELKKLISWEGWKKELMWIVFFALLLFAAYSYNRDINLCRPYLEDPCSKCAERDTAMIESLQNQIGAMKEANKINIDDLEFYIVNG